jgi:hypothetical protein
MNRFIGFLYDLPEFRDEFCTGSSAPARSVVC